MNHASSVRLGRLSAALGFAAVVAALAAPALATTPGGTLSNTIDLPVVVPSTSIVGEGNVQVETGVARVKDGSGTSIMSVWSTPTMLRLGMPNYEIRLQSDAYTHMRNYTSLNTGMSDVTLGIKGVVPQTIDKDLSVAVMLQAGLPSGSSKVKNNGVRPEVQAVAAWQLPNQNSISGVVGFRSDVAPNNDRYPTGILGMNYTHVWNAQLATYGEFAGRQLRTAARGGKNMMWDLGASYAVVPGTHLNATAGWGLKDNDTDMAWTVGISTRFRPAMPNAMAHRAKSKTNETPSASTEDGK